MLKINADVTSDCSVGRVKLLGLTVWKKTLKFQNYESYMEFIDGETPVLRIYENHKKYHLTTDIDLELNEGSYRFKNPNMQQFKSHNEQFLRLIYPAHKYDLVMTFNSNFEGQIDISDHHKVRFCPINGDPKIILYGICLIGK